MALDQARAQWVRDDATLKQAQIRSQQLNLTYCHIVAPADGRVGLRQVDPGNYVQAGSTTGIVVLTLLRPISVIFSVAEDSVPAIMARVQAGAALPVMVFDRANVDNADGAPAHVSIPEPRQNRLVASVSLVAALGGGWDTSQLSAAR